MKYLILTPVVRLFFKNNPPDSFRYRTAIFGLSSLYDIMFDVTETKGRIPPGQYIMSMVASIEKGAIAIILSSAPIISLS